MTQPLFRAGENILLQDAADLSGLRPRLHPEARLLAFDYDISPYLQAREPEDFPLSPPPGRSHLVVFPNDSESNSVVQIGEELADFLRQCDGVRTCEQLASTLPIDLERVGEQLIALLIDNFITFTGDDAADYHCMDATKF